MERMTLIKIAKKGRISSWFNEFINVTFVGYMEETGNEFKLRLINGDELWIGKEFVEVKLHESTSWVSGSKFIYSDRDECSSTEYDPGMSALTKKQFEKLKNTSVEPTNVLLESITETFNKCLSIAKAKNNDYGGSSKTPFANFENSTVAGVSVERGILVRLMDKMSRISTLLDKEAKVKDESIVDTIEDAINYLAILKAYINHKK